MQTRRGSRLLLLFSALLLAGICLWQNAPALIPRHVSASAHVAQSHYIIAEDGVRLNVNLADAGELTELPGIGEVLAQRIIDYREEHGPFASMEELVQVSGVGERTLERLREFAAVSDP